MFPDDNSRILIPILYVYLLLYEADWGFIQRSKVIVEILNYGFQKISEELFTFPHQIMIFTCLSGGKEVYWICGLYICQRSKLKNEMNISVFVKGQSNYLKEYTSNLDKSGLILAVNRSVILHFHWLLGWKSSFSVRTYVSQSLYVFWRNVKEHAKFHQ